MNFVSAPLDRTFVLTACNKSAMAASKSRREILPTYSDVIRRIHGFTLLPKLGGFWLLPRDFPHLFLSGSHPMDHDSDSSGHANMHARHQSYAQALGD